jgi:hypothetical protein
MDSIDVLDFLLRSRIPTLGATDFNAYEVIMSLVVENGMLLINFLSKAQDIQAQLTLSAHPQEDNTLFKQFLTQFMRTNVHTYVSSVFKDFNKFSKRTGGRKRYENDTINSVSTDLIDAKADDVLYLKDYKPSNAHVNDPSPFKDGHNKHRSRSNFSRLKFAPMNVNTQNEGAEATEQEQGLADDNDEEIECT